MLDIWMGTEESLKTFKRLEERFLQSEMRAPTVPSSDISHLIEDLGKGVFALNINGSLVNKKSFWHELVGGITSYEEITNATRQLAANDKVKKVIVGITSGGGQASGLNDASDSLQELAKTKEVFSYVNSAALSAGYWLAASTPKIYANKMAELGSIGVMAVIQDYSEAAKKEGITFHVLKAGKFKAAEFGGKALTEENLAYLQERIDKTNNFFMTHVAENRSVSLSDYEEWGDAKVFYAGEAKAVGLIDGISSIVELVGGETPAKQQPRGGMKMTYEQKLAQIAAGVSPETILSSEELIKFKAEEEPEIVEPVLQGEVEEVESAEPVEPTAPVEASGDLMNMAMQVGTLTAKLEAAQEKLQEATSSLEAYKTNIAKMSTVAKAAVTNLQVALSAPRVEKEDPVEILAQYEELQAKLKTKYPGKRVSAQSEVGEGKELHIPDPLNPLGK